ncbi:acyl-coenzyme A synthetase ACSM3, mitochondrial-like isoform X3 [Macaca nemestrina]|uniref:acyl-coenzyme A synthetase ACSM3, mitochondrial-like isoform X3 n=1 Tax=Macaca nemestrina TaxID=9545 RepID=UPI0039B84057
MSVALKPQRSRKLLSLKTSDSIWCPSTQAGFWLPWGPCLNHGQEGVQSSSIMCRSLTPRSSYRVTQRRQPKWNVGSTFYNTRDRATMDEEGYIWFLGRSHDTINASGWLNPQLNPEPTDAEPTDFIAPKTWCWVLLPQHSWLPNVGQQRPR